MSPSKLLQAHSIFKMVIDHDIMHPALVDDDDDLRRKTARCEMNNFLIEHTIIHVPRIVYSRCLFLRKSMLFTFAFLCLQMKTNKID